ncbi:hypothetical protein H9P43_006064 [Blastocladiella emersonii ATCC 22665]|nr:hypothetical protein H9P43_006064 [Blastocladiella emersonii ATCC 22665]
MRFIAALVLALLAVAALLSPSATASPQPLGAKPNANGMVDVIVSYYKPGAGIESATGPKAGARTLTADELTRALTAGGSPAAIQESASGSGAYVQGADLVKALTAAGAKVKYEYSIIDAVAVSVPADVAQRLGALQNAKLGVMAVENDAEVHTMEKSGAAAVGINAIDEF